MSANELRDRIVDGMKEFALLNPRRGLMSSVDTYTGNTMHRGIGGIGYGSFGGSSGFDNHAPGNFGFHTPGAINQSGFGNATTNGFHASGNGMAASNTAPVAGWASASNTPSPATAGIWTAEETSPAAQAFYANETQLFGGEPELLVTPSEWENVLDVLFEKHSSTRPAAYTTRRSISDTTVMARRGLRFGQKQPDTRNPGPDKPTHKKNPTDKAGVVLTCFACNLQYHLIFNCPHASRAQLDSLNEHYLGISLLLRKKRTTPTCILSLPLQAVTIFPRYQTTSWTISARWHSRELEDNRLSTSRTGWRR